MIGQHGAEWSAADEGVAHSVPALCHLYILLLSAAPHVPGLLPSCYVSPSVCCPSCVRSVVPHLISPIMAAAPHVMSRLISAAPYVMSPLMSAVTHVMS